MRDSSNTQNILDALPWKVWKQVVGEYKSILASCTVNCMEQFQNRVQEQALITVVSKSQGLLPEV
jgi:hypothetical protein